jgi:hypothetical protein
MRRALTRIVVLGAVALAASSAPADGAPACGANGISASPFDPSDTRMRPEEARFVSALFETTRSIAAENTGALRWLLSARREGLHVDDHRGRVESALRALEARGVPDRVAPVRDLVREAVAAQLSFFDDWRDAIEAGHPFESQLTSEFGWHEGLDLAHRALLRAYTKLLALDPAEPEDNRRAFHAELCGLARLGAAR